MIASAGVSVNVSVEDAAMGADVDAAMWLDVGVGAEQEADKRISTTQNERCKKVIVRLTNHIVSENLSIYRENLLGLIV